MGLHAEAFQPDWLDNELDYPLSPHNLSIVDGVAELTPIPLEIPRLDFLGKISKTFKVAGEIVTEDFLDDKEKVASKLVAIRHLGSEARQDFKESDQKIRFLGITAAMGVFQFIEHSQLAVIAITSETVDIYKDTHSAVAAGAAAGGMTYIWNHFVGESLSEGLHRLRKTVDHYGKNFMGSTKLVYDTLPANHAIDTKDGTEPSAARKGAQYLKYHGSNGLSGSLRGMSSYVATTSVLKDRDKDHVKRFYRRAAFDSAIVSALLFTGAQQVISIVGASDPKLANTISNYEGNRIVELEALMLFCAAQLALNRRHQAKKELASEDQSMLTR